MDAIFSREGERAAAIASRHMTIARDLRLDMWPVTQPASPSNSSGRLRALKIPRPLAKAPPPRDRLGAHARRPESRSPQIDRR